jgi:CxxC motif-containing protein
MEENDKTRTLTCITCPIGCTLTVTMQGNNVAITGNRCPRGATYATEELTAPKRVVTATAALRLTKKTARQLHQPDMHTTVPPRNSPDIHRVPVRTTAPCPKEQINSLLHDIYALRVELPVISGQPLLKDWHGLGFDVVVARTVRT